MLKTLAAFALGSAFLVGCGANKDESAPQTESPSPAMETPVPGDEMTPAEIPEVVPADEPAPAMSDTLPTAEDPPPLEPAPPPGR